MGIADSPEVASLSRWLSILRLSVALRFAFAVFLAASALPCSATKFVTVEQLEQILSARHDETDTKMAVELVDLSLIERLSTARLLRDEAGLPGPLSRQALTAVADISAFLNPPEDETPSLAIPDAQAQREMIALAANYVNQTIHQLPNFFARRVTTNIEDNPWYDGGTTGSSESYYSFIPSKSLHQVGSSTATVLYRRGREVVHGSGAQTASQGLTVSGEFGPILVTALLDAVQGHLVWSHWEQGKTGPQAVYRYVVAADKSHFEVAYCCVHKLGMMPMLFRQFSTYAGEITIDPSNGTILRLSFKATSFQKNDPIDQAKVLVEYGPVEIGGKTYICPLKSVAFSLGLAIQPESGFRVQYAPLQTRVNDVVFDQYHLYRATSTILPTYTDSPE
jgi:hypothetical protein